MLLTLVVMLVNLVVFGGHLLFPLRAAGGDTRTAILWARTALPALGLATALTLVAIRRSPDAALAWGIVGPLTGPLPIRMLAVAILALVAADAVALLAAEKLGRREWTVQALFGGLALVLVTWGSEMLRYGAGPVPMPWPLLFGALLRLPLALAAAELASGKPRFAAPLAAPLLLVSVPIWPTSLRGALGPDLLTLAVGAVLLAASRFLPAKFQRFTGIVGLLLTTVVLARSAAAAGVLGTMEELPVELLAP